MVHGLVGSGKVPGYYLKETPGRRVIDDLEACYKLIENNLTREAYETAITQNLAITKLEALIIDSLRETAAGKMTKKQAGEIAKRLLKPVTKRQASSYAVTKEAE